MTGAPVEARAADAVVDVDLATRSGEPAGTVALEVVLQVLAGSAVVARVPVALVHVRLAVHPGVACVDQRKKQGPKNKSTI